MTRTYTNSIILRFNKLQRVAREQFSSRSTENFQDQQQVEAVNLANDILQRPEDWQKVLERSVCKRSNPTDSLHLLLFCRSIASSILTADYGWLRLADGVISDIQSIYAHTAKLSLAALPGSNMFDLFPILRNLPDWMSKSKRDAREWHEQETRRFDGFLKDAESKMVCALRYTQSPQPQVHHGQYRLIII